MNFRGFFALVGCAALVGSAAPCHLGAQIGPIPAIAPPVRGAGAWRKVRTEHFEFDYREEFAAWTATTAARMEAVRLAVRDRVGYAPNKRVTVIVDDPINESNGNAYSWLDHPQIQLYPVPPSPRSQLGNDRDWSDLLVVHEFAHLAHLTRPSRIKSFVFSVPGVPPVGPLGQMPRWVKEGYATVIEGALTGSGRPSSVIRASILRQYAADGLLPSYANMSLVGSFPYLMGSAFLEHLAATYGDSTLPQLWRRLSARTPRTFTTAFEQTFGVRVEDAYARYTARLTANALAIETALDSAGRVEGSLEVAGSGAFGDPAVSRDGKRLAIGLPGNGRLVIWPTAAISANTRDSLRRAAAARLLARDSLDVPPVEMAPRSKHVLASLAPSHGFGYRLPRFMADSERALVIRGDVRGDGSTMPDLYEWNFRTGHVRRVTRWAAIREADPFPDNAHAVGARCLAGQCDLVVISLRNGAVTLLRAGSPSVQYVHPRVSPDGTRIVAGEQRDGLWHVVLVDPATGSVTPVGPADGAHRYDFTWMHDGATLIGISEVGGIPNVERMNVATGAVTPQSRVFAAAMAPEPMPDDSVAFMLTLSTRGYYDLRRLSLANATAAVPLSPAARALLTDSHQGAVVKQPGFTMPSFTTGPVSSPRPYGIGPQRVNWLPIGGAAADGAFLGLGMFGSDPNNRFSWVAQQAWNTNTRLPSGGVARAVLRLPVLSVDGEASLARLPGERWTGGALAVSRSWRDAIGLTGFRVGGSYHRVERDTPADDGTDGRTHAWLALNRAIAARSGARSIRLDLRGQMSRTNSITASDSRTNTDHHIGMALAELNLGAPFTVIWEGTAGDTHGDNPSERYTLGGVGTRMIDPSVVSRNIAVPWLSAGALTGTQFVEHVVRLGMPTVQPTAWAVRTDGGMWHRALGFEASQESFASGFSREPGISMTAGIAYLFDPPHADRLHGWVALSLRP